VKQNNRPKLKTPRIARVANLTVFYPAPLTSMPAMKPGMRPAVRLGKNTLLALTHYHHLDGPYAGQSQAHFGVPAIYGESSLTSIRDLFKTRQKSWGFCELFTIDGQSTLLASEQQEVLEQETVQAVTKPAYLTTNQWVLTHNQFFWQTMINGKPLFTVSGHFELGLPFPSLSYLAYPHIADPVFFTPSGSSRVHWPGSLRLTLGENAHPVHDKIKAFGIEEKTPALLMTSPELVIKLSSQQKVSRVQTT